MELAHCRPRVVSLAISQFIKLLVLLRKNLKSRAAASAVFVLGFEHMALF